MAWNHKAKKLPPPPKTRLTNILDYFRIVHQGQLDIIQLGTLGTVHGLMVERWLVSQGVTKGEYLRYSELAGRVGNYLNEANDTYPKFLSRDLAKEAIRTIPDYYRSAAAKELHQTWSRPAHFWWPALLDNEVEVLLESALREIESGRSPGNFSLHLPGIERWQMLYAKQFEDPLVCLARQAMGPTWVADV